MLNIVSGALNSVFSLSSKMILRLFLGFCSSCALMYTHRRFTTWHAQASSSVVLWTQEAAQASQEATVQALTSVRGMRFSPRKTCSGSDRMLPKADCFRFFFGLMQHLRLHF